MSDQLTVIVKDGEGQPAANAQVSTTPGDAMATTNENGEAVIPLGSANTYQVTVKLGKEKQTVPFYVSEGGARRLDVNMQYLKTHNTTTLPTTTIAPKTANNSSDNLAAIGVIVAIAVIATVIFLLFRKKRNA